MPASDSGPGSAAATTAAGGRLILVYDGDCPLCRHYALLTRVNAGSGGLQLHNARDGGAIVAAISARGLKLDEGMVLIIDGAYHHGASALHVLALVGTSSDRFNQAMRGLFRNPRRARLLYPVLRAGRALLLKLTGRRPIDG